MAVTRFDLLVDDPDAVLKWLEARDNVVRKAAYRTVIGWHVKVAIEEGDVAAEFKEEWAESLATPERVSAFKLRMLSERRRLK